MKKKLPIGVFMFLTNAVVLCIGFFAIVIFENHALREVTNRQTNMNLHVFAETICLFLESEMAEKNNMDILAKKIAGDHPEFRITIVDNSGTVVAESSVPDISKIGNYLDRKEIVSALNGQFYSIVRRSALNGKLLRYYSMPLELSGENYAVRISVPVSMSAFLSSNIRWQIIWVAAIIFAVIAVVSFAVEIKIARYIQKLEKVRKDFVINVSHELKTPVTSIKGFSETLLDTPDLDAATSRHFVEIINSQSVRLVNIIDDLMALAYLEHDEKPLEMTPCNVTELLQSACDNFKDAAKNKNISLVFNAEADSIMANLNARLFEQAVRNIIDNAVKYCPNNSEISCSVTCAENDTSKSQQHQNEIKIVIEDSGNGIPEKYHERIFERFFRVDKGRSRENGGTGLGLSITRHIIKLHGGTVTASSRLDGKSGSRFVITINN